MPNKRKTLNITGSNLWYLVGLIATDGCLSSDGRHIDITSKDYDYLNLLRNTIGITNKIGSKYGIKKQRSFRIQIGNKVLYNFLLSIGLTQKKSLTLRGLNVPHKYFADFFRGVVDGDGCIRKWMHPSNSREQWSLRVYSGSAVFLKWLKNDVECLLNAKGKIHRKTDNLWILKYGKMAAKEISKNCYYEGCLGLGRKIKLAQECRDSYKGWSRSRTVSHNLA